MHDQTNIGIEMKPLSIEELLFSAHPSLSPANSLSFARSEMELYYIDILLIKVMAMVHVSLPKMYETIIL